MGDASFQVTKILFTKYYNRYFDVKTGSLARLLGSTFELTRLRV
jgi:hypothetical protein